MKELGAQKIALRHRNLVIRLTLVAFVCGLTALLFLVNSRADTLSLAIEAEDGQISTAAALDAAGASGGRAVRFAGNGSGSSADMVYGLTIDNAAYIEDSLLNSQLEAIKRLPRHTTTRLVFDDVPAAEYTKAINAMRPHTTIMGQPLDSYYMTRFTNQQNRDRAAAYISALKDTVDVWEIGNEVNGNWTGAYSDVSTKITDIYDLAKAAGEPTALTLWYNPNCKGDDNELDIFQFSNQYVSASMRSGLDYVYISYYETICNDLRQTPAQLTQVFEQLHALYPNAKLGFGEIGTPDPVTTATLANAQSIARYYYGLDIDLPYYVGGYFWWNFSQDAVPYTKPMWQTLNEAMASY